MSCKMSFVDKPCSMLTLPTLVEDSLPRFVRVRLRYQVFGRLLLKGWSADGGFNTVTQQTDLRFLLPCSRIGTRIGERKDKRQHEGERNLGEVRRKCRMVKP